MSQAWKCATKHFPCHIIFQRDEASNQVQKEFASEASKFKRCRYCKKLNRFLEVFLNVAFFARFLRTYFNIFAYIKIFRVLKIHNYFGLIRLWLSCSKYFMYPVHFWNRVGHKKCKLGVTKVTPYIYNFYFTTILRRSAHFLSTSYT